MRLIRLIPVAALLAAAAGCGDGPKYVPVSGVIKVDGKPYKNAVVSFQPVGTPDNPAPGQGSSALTDEEGRYTLVCDNGQTGAVAGKHRVRIQTKRDDPMAFIDPEVGSPDDLGPLTKKGARIDPIPPEWYSDNRGVEYIVPPKGTDQANFDIDSIQSLKKGKPK